MMVPTGPRKKFFSLTVLSLMLPILVQADTLTSIEGEARDLLAQGQAMNRSVLAAGVCGQKMRTLQPQVRRLQSRIDALPNPKSDTFYLGVAANYLFLCVSCHEKLGPTHCSEAASYLHKMDSKR